MRNGMKTAEEYLRERGLLKDGFTKFVVSFENGEQFDVVELMEEYASQPKWISVEERLPDESGKYLVSCRNKNGDQWFRTASFIKTYLDGYWRDYMYITHWHPITPPTK